MSKKPRRQKQRSLKLAKPITELSDDELWALGDATPAGHPYGRTLLTEMSRRLARVEESASPEEREVMHYIRESGFQEFLDADEKHRKAFESAIRAGSPERLEQVVHAINARNSEPVPIHIDDVWQAWPVFVNEVYNGEHPEWLAKQETYLNDFMHWMITNEHYPFYRLIDDKAGIEWLRKVAELLVVPRRIAEWKLRQYLDHGIDHFASKEMRDEMVEAYRAGKFVFWDEQTWDEQNHD